MVSALPEVFITTTDNGLLIAIPDNLEWYVAARDLYEKLSKLAPMAPDQRILLDLGRRALNVPQLEALRAELRNDHHLSLHAILSLNDATRLAADGLELWTAMSLPPAPGAVAPKPEPPQPNTIRHNHNALYMKQNFRSGQSLRHDGTVIICGDVNSGAEITADGDIIVLGTLRGTAHAGANGDAGCQIVALSLRPTQLRIAGFIARRPDHASQAPSAYPEVARVQGAEIHVIPLRDMH
jgi:septum site-determining protein MinC